jgi:acyl-CoA reductase-like NAD-dependent aldehyde dehydrogenase
MMGMGQKAAPALAAGNTVVAKPRDAFGAVRFVELRSKPAAGAR